MAITKRELGNNYKTIANAFKKIHSDGLGGLRFKCFCEGWVAGFKEAKEINNNEKKSPWIMVKDSKPPNTNDILLMYVDNAVHEGFYNGQWNPYTEPGCNEQSVMAYMEKPELPEHEELSVQDCKREKSIAPKESPHPLLCFQHGGGPKCDEINKQHGFICPKCEKFTQYLKKASEENFTLYLKKASEEVASWPNWKQTALGFAKKDTVETPEITRKDLLTPMSEFEKENGITDSKEKTDNFFKKILSTFLNKLGKKRE